MAGLSRGEYCVFFVLILFAQKALTAKILAFYPKPWKSNHYVVQPLLIELAKRGHSVDYYTPNPISSPPNGLQQFILHNWFKKAKGVYDADVPSKGWPFGAHKLLYDFTHEVLVNSFIHDKPAIELLQSNKSYDAVISEFMLYNEAVAYLAHKFNALNIMVSSFPDIPWIQELAGLPDNPSYIVNYLCPFTHELTFLERLNNIYTTISIILVSYYEVLTNQQAFADKYMRYEGWKSRPKLLEVMSNTSLILMSYHMSTSFPYPRAPNMKDVAGMHILPQELPEDYEQFIDNSPHGVIYFSLGSVVDPDGAVADGKLDHYMSVFRKIKHKIIWKVTPRIMEQINDPKLKLGTWHPQQAILRQKNIVLFITHGGLQSTIEAIANGVPCLNMPVFADQFKNSRLIEYYGMGLTLNFDNFTEQNFMWSINEVLTNPNYKKQALKRQALFNDRPKTPLDEGVYWVEYVLRHGNVLQAASSRMPFYQVYLLDVLAFLLVGGAFSLYTLKKLLVAIWCRISPYQFGNLTMKKIN